MLEFFSSPFFVISSGISAIVVIAGFIYTMISIIRGISPALIKLGKGLSGRKISIFSDSNFESLRDLLIDSDLFKEKNIIQIHGDSLKKSESTSLFLVYYPDFKDRIDEILALKKDSTSLIVYSPSEHEKMKHEVFIKINSQRNSTVVNFRGRLLSDLFAAMITTGGKNKRN